MTATQTIQKAETKRTRIGYFANGNSKPNVRVLSDGEYRRELNQLLDAKDRGEIREIFILIEPMDDGEEEKED